MAKHTCVVSKQCSVPYKLCNMDVLDMFLPVLERANFAENFCQTIFPTKYSSFLLTYFILEPR